MRRPQPRPLVVPEDEPPAYRLTASGVFEQGGIIVSRAGCVIAGGADGGATPLTDDGPPPWLRGGGSDCAGGGSSPSSSRLPSPQPPWWRDGDTDDSSSQLPELAPSTQQQQSPILPPRELQQQQQHTPQRTAAAIALEDLQDLGVVGSGSGGVVRGVRHVPSGERLVLKSIRLDLGSEAALGRVVSEVRSLAAAAHPHVVSYRQAFLVDGALTILMEWMDGGSLADVLGRVRAVPGRLLPELARQATEGLAHLHGGPRICHRDLKPSNLLLSSAGVLKVGAQGSLPKICLCVQKKSVHGYAGVHVQMRTHTHIHTCARAYVCSTARLCCHSHCPPPLLLHETDCRLWSGQHAQRGRQRPLCQLGGYCDVHGT
jgi:Protein kinase domain